MVARVAFGGEVDVQTWVAAAIVGTSVCFVLLSLHVWRKTLRAGMPAVLPTTTKLTAAERRRESRDRDSGLDASATLYLIIYKFLLGWQYYNALLLCTTDLPRTASDAPEVVCIYLRVCKAIQRHVKSVSQAKYYSILGSGAVLQVYDLQSRINK
jgi:hypothetical protein